MIEKSYNIALLVLSISVATVGAYAATEIARRVCATEGRRRHRWVYGGALAMALGVWSMDFIGLLALRLSVPVWYEAVLVIASFIAAVMGCAIAFFVLNRVSVSFSLRAIASVFMGVAFAGMHYTSMAAMRMNAGTLYDPIIMATALGIAIAVSYNALTMIEYLVRVDTQPRGWIGRAGGSLFLALTFFGIQFAGTGAASFTSGTTDWKPAEGLVLGSFRLGVAIAVISIVVLALAIAATQFERWSIATRSKFENLLELAPQILWFAEPDGRITYCNPYWYDYTGLSEMETVGYGWTNAIHPDDRDRVVTSWQNAVKEGKDYEGELRLRHNDGSYCWFLARGRPGRDESGKVNAWLGLALDIEERKKAEEQALAASQAKSEFLASMSHELRTPLNAIGGYAELLAMGIRGSLNADQAQDIARIRRSQKHLLTLINDVLNFAKVDAGQAEYRLTAVPVDEALHDTESMIAPQILAKGLRYTYKSAGRTASVLADPEKLQQIVLNLLTNAVKFTDSGGAITLSATPRANCVDIAVADTGAGIPAEKLEKVFDPFVQAERRLNQPVQGVGLGLAISRDLAHAMGGEITLQSTLGKGSTFTLSLPRAPRMNAADVAAATAAALDDEKPANVTSPNNASEPEAELADRPLEEAAHP